jgi:hypothetical protein
MLNFIRDWWSEMTPGMRALLIVFSIAILIAAWMLRLDVKPGSAPSVAFITNRWTGTVYLCFVNDVCAVTYPLPLNQPHEKSP